MPATSLTTFSRVSHEEVQALLREVIVSKATGSDGIPANILHTCADELAGSLTCIFNESLATGIFPILYKIASVTPLLKAGDPCPASNYRPISLLPIVSKLLEKIVLKQLRKYIEDNPDLNILPPQQFAYRSHHSTEDALSCAINRWQCSLEERNVVGVFFLDMSKAFDRIRHDTLLDDLFQCGIGGTALS